MSSSNFLPKRAEFFAFLAAHTDRVVAAANATSRLVNGLGNPAGAAETANLIDEVNSNATSGDRIKDDFVQILFEAFTTPISRDLLHTLILNLDRVLGKLMLPGFPLRFSEQAQYPARVAPLLGEHNEAVLGGLLGYGRARLDALRDAKVMMSGAT